MTNRYLNASQHGKTDLAVENLHKFFDQNLRHLFSLEKVTTLTKTGLIKFRLNQLQTKSDKLF